MRKLTLIAAVFLAGWLRAHPIVVDGDPSDWVGVGADTAVVDSGEWIVSDPVSDDLGDNGDAPGAPDNPDPYTYPTGLSNGTADIHEVRFTLAISPDTMPSFFYGLVRINTLNQNTIVTILLDVDTVFGSNFTLDSSDVATERAWDLAVVLHDNDINLYDFMGNPINASQTAVFNYSEGVIEFGLSVEDLPEPSGMMIWAGIYAGVTFGNGEYAEVDSLASSTNGGGGMNATADPDAYDVVAPDDASQTAFLSSYTSSSPAIMPSSLFYPINLVELMDFIPLEIEEIQGHTSSSPYEGVKVLTWGIVSGVYSRGFFLQDVDSLGYPYPWSGIYVYTGSTPTVSRGYVISIVAEVDEYYGLTELKNIDTIIVVDSNNYVQPVYVPTGDVADEQWEGVFVAVDSAVCVDPDLGYGEWLVDDGSGPVRIDDMGYAYSPDSGHVYRIIGPVYYSYGNFKIEPRDSADVIDLTQGPPNVPVVKINEIYYDSPGADHGTFTELIGAPGTSLDNVHLIGINGSNGQIYADIDLSGFYIDSSGYFVVAQDTSVMFANYIDPDVNWQNGPDNVLLVFITGSDTILMDAVGYGSEDTTTWHFFGETLPTIDVRSGYSIARIPDGLDSDSNVVDFTQLPPTPGEYNGVLLFSDDFETGATSWSGDWGVTQATSHLGNYSFSESPNGNYPNNANLIANLNVSFDLTNFFGAYLQFYHAYWIEQGFDFGHVEVSTDGGNTWTEVASYTGNLTHWEFESIDLSAFCGMSDVRIRFRLTSDGAVTEDGWYIDDLKVVSSMVDLSPPLIVYDPLADTISVLDTLFVQVDYFDPSGIMADTLYYSIDGVEGYTLSDSAIGSTYYYSITGLTPGAFFEYQFRVVDFHGNENISQWYQHIAGRILYRDDGEPGYITLPDPGDSLAVRFDNIPADSIWVTTLLYNFYMDPNHDIDTVTVHVWDSNAVDLIPPREVYPVNTLDNPFAWTAVDIRNENLYVPGGMPFYVGVVYRDSIPAILIDSPGSFNSSYRYTNGAFNLLGIDIFIRAIVGVYGTGVSESNLSYPFRLMQNSPNPVKDRTRITFSIPVSGHVELVLYDISGRKIKTLLSGDLEKGLHTVDVSTAGLRNGIYFYTLRANGKVETRKMMILK